MYVVIKLSWWKHPFLKNSFKIESEDQIATIQGLESDKIYYDASLSERPSKPETKGASQEAPEEKLSEFEQELKKIRQEKINLLAAQQKKLKECDAKYQKSLTQTYEITKEVSGGQQEGVEKARLLIADIVETLQGGNESVMVHLINLKEMERVTHFHSLNVSILAAIVGHHMGLGAEELTALGLAAIFHDIGKLMIPKKVILKKPPLSKAELDYLQMHPLYGYKIVKNLPDFSPSAMESILQHHERINGKGYPRGLKGNQIHMYANIIAIVDIYDNLCNQGSEDNVTPHEAVATMYNKYKDELHQKILETFIRRIGVYPPGTLVKLSDGSVGMVIVTETKKILKPKILVYAEQEPIDGPIIIDTAEQSIEVERTLKTGELTRQEFDYLRPDRGFGYFVHKNI